MMDTVLFFEYKKFLMCKEKGGLVRGGDNTMD